MADCDALLMADPQIEKLLAVQSCDVRLQTTEQDLARLPKERAAHQARIESERNAIEEARQSVAALEVRRNDLDTQVKSLESDIQRFRNQQLEVKKNEEYRALTEQIEQSQEKISGLEEQEIELMYSIDSAKEAFEEQKAGIESRIGEEEKLISMLKEKEHSLADLLQAARSDLAREREKVDEVYLEEYDRVRRLVRRAPYVAAIEGQKCGGCHLRVSNEVAKAAASSGEPHFCDQCGRIVFTK